MSAQEAMNKLLWYRKQLDTVKNDDTILQAARERQFNNLAQSMELYGRTTALQEFKTAWNDIRHGFDVINAQRRMAAQKVDDKFDFTKLRYYKELAQADIANAQSLDEVQKLLRDTVELGGREQARAALECTGAVLARFRGYVGVGALVSWMESEAAKLLSPPETDKYDEQEHELILQTVKLYDVTTSAANMVSSSGIGELLRQVKIAMKYDSVLGNYRYTVTFIEPYGLPIPEPRPEPVG